MRRIWRRMMPSSLLWCRMVMWSVHLPQILNVRYIACLFLFLACTQTTTQLSKLCKAANLLCWCRLRMVCWCGG